MRIFVNEFCGHPFQMELSRKLAKMGHAVYHVYFADNQSTPKGETQRRADDSSTLTIEGVHIQRAFSKHSLLTRRQADLEYGREVAARVDRFRPDVVISANMPLDAQKILQQATRRGNARFVFWLQDVYSVAVRFVLERKAKPLAWAGGLYFERLEKKLLRQSDQIVCIAPGFADFVRNWGIAESKTAVIRNWAPLNEVTPTARDNAWARENGVADKFCFMYSGTLGMKHRPELLLDLAKRLEARGDARLIVIAGGAGADWLKEKAPEVSPEFLTVLPFQPYERISEVMGSADVLITLLDSEAKTFAVPSKTLSYLCAARALIVAAPAANEAARVVEEAEAGLVVSPDNSTGILAAAERLLLDRALCVQCGANGRRYAEQHFSIDAIADRFLAVLEGQPKRAEMEPRELVLANADSERKESWKHPA
ncbi:MAG TPA: glycosyltransferase family 4 protein [Acidobacteriaceae bacterium]|jgi:glycosyltransferase involved in cell wall biosynthesis|nr:glycosyltransferase family 4 protein [Acidobacteriaceae bacterium]